MRVAWPNKFAAANRSAAEQSNGLCYFVSEYCSRRPRAAVAEVALSACSPACTLPNLQEQTMNEPVSLSEYLVISRGQWDKDLSREEIQNAIDQFYVWLGRLVDEGR